MEVTITITDADWQILKHELKDPQAWIEAAVAGKVNSCKKRLIKSAPLELIEDPNVTTMPADKTELLNVYFTRANYKTRYDKE